MYHEENIPRLETYRKLPTRLFSVRVPIIATYSDEEIMMYGLPTDTIDDKPDPKCYEHMTTSMVNLDRIIGMYENGFKINIIKQEESAFIYKALEQFLVDWNTTIQNSPNMRVNTTKDDRLETIDKFLTEIFDHNRPTIVKDSIGSQMGYSMNMGLLSHQGGSQRTNPVIQNGVSVGVTAGYESQQPIDQGTTYIQPHMPVINPNDIQRKNIIKLGGNITAGYNDIIN